MADKYDYICKTATVTLPGGIKRRIKVYGKTEKEAITKLAKLKAEYELGLLTFNGNTLFATWAEEYTEQYLKPCLQKHTYQNMQTKLNKYILPTLGSYAIKDIKPANIHNCLMQMQGKSEDYCRKTKQLLSKIFEEAVINDMINRNPVTAVKLPQTAEKQERRSLTDAEKETFMQTVTRHPKGIMFAVLLGCGLRPQEVRALTWQDIDLKNRILTVQGAVASGEKRIKAPKSKAGYRTIPLPQWLAELLNKHIRDISTPFVFYGTGNKPMTEQCFRRAWSSFIREWDIIAGAELYRNQIITHKIDQHITPYYLRHTYATSLAEKSVDMKTAQYLLGHSSIKMTAEIYTHITGRMIETAREKIDLSL